MKENKEKELNSFTKVFKLKLLSQLKSYIKIIKNKWSKLFNKLQKKTKISNSLSTINLMFLKKKVI